MNEFKNSHSADEIQTTLNQTLAQMAEHQKTGNYIEAEKLRVMSEQLKKDLEARRIYEMEQKHHQEKTDLARTREDQLKTFNDFWDKKLDEYGKEGEKLIRDMQAKHQVDLQSLKNDMEKQLPYKVKESSEYLNLKKMEEHMAKQKLYTEAHKVQLRLQDLQKSQKESWMNARNLKIETASNTLRAKQAAELAALQKKIRTGVDEQNKERSKEEARLNLKYHNIERQLKASQDKQILAFRGQFRSKGGQGSPMLLGKSKYLSTSK